METCIIFEVLNNKIKTLNCMKSKKTKMKRTLNTLALVFLTIAFLCSCSRYSSPSNVGCKQTWKMNGYK